MILAATALTHGLEKAGLILDALLAAALLALPAARRTPRLRAGLLTAALILTPALLLAALWRNHKLETVHHHPLHAAAAIAAALVVIAALALLLHRRPTLLPYLTLLALPFRIPLGSVSSGLLVPLYAVIAAGALSQITRTWSTRGTEAGSEREKFGRTPELLGASLLLYALQATYSTDLAKAIEQAGFFYVPFALLFDLLRGVRWERELLTRLLWLTSALGVLFALVGLAELADHHHLLVNRSLDADAAFVRINSLFYDPNVFGRFLALAMILLTTALLFERRRREQVLAAAALLVMWAGLLVSLSQSSMVALVAGLAIAAIGRWGRRAAATVAVLAALALAGALAYALHSHNSAGDLTSGRSSLVRGGYDLFKDRPLYGYGSGSFAKEYLAHVPHRQSAFERHEHLPFQAPSTSDSHTAPITIAAEQGLIGLAVYLALLLVAFGTLLRTVVRRPTTATPVAIAAAFTGLVVHTFLYADFLEDPATWVLLAVGTALAARSAAPRPIETAHI